MQEKKKRFFLQPASRQLQSAEKIGMRFFLALPGLKSGARRSENKRRFFNKR